MNLTEQNRIAFAQLLQRDREWGDARPSPSAEIWDRDQLAEAYLLAGMDRRALLRAAYDRMTRAGAFRDAIAAIDKLP